MMKAGLIDEMVNDALDSALDTEDMEEETEQEIEKVLAELAVDTAAALPSAKVRRRGWGCQVWMVPAAKMGCL